MSCQACTVESAHSGGGQGTCGRQQGHSGGSCAHLVRLCHNKAKHSIWAGWRTSEHCSGGRLRVPCGHARARRCCPVPGQQPDADMRPGRSLPRTVLPRCPALAPQRQPQQSDQSGAAQARLSSWGSPIHTCEQCGTHLRSGATPERHLWHPSDWRVSSPRPLLATLDS